MPRDPREWIAVASTMPEHPKVEGLSDAAFRLLLDMWCWSKRQRTDGFVPDATWRRRRSPKVRTELTDAGLFEVVEGGVRVHDWSEHQQTEAERTDLSAKRAVAGAAGGRAKASNRLANATASSEQVPSKSSSNDVASAKQTASKALAEKRREEETREQNPPEEPPAAAPMGRGNRLPEGWEPPLDAVTAMRAEFPHLDLRAAHERFSDHWRSATRNATKRDWLAAWRNWIREDARRYAPRRAAGSDSIDWERAEREAVELDRIRGLA